MAPHSEPGSGPGRAAAIVRQYRRALTRWAVKRQHDETASSVTLEQMMVRLRGPEWTNNCHHLADMLDKYNNLISCPVLGVMGELNAGKSTVVSSFLSPQGQSRLPRGITENKGTHRFVYWVPQSWLDDDTQKKLLFELLETVHGKSCGIDRLPSDSDSAEEMYRQGETDPEAFFTPVVAGDPALDALNLAFLDCPDVKTAPLSSRWKIEKRDRQHFVAEASRLCSAILFVVDHGHIRDESIYQLLNDVRRKVSPVPIYLLVNKVEPTADAVRDLARSRHFRQLAEPSEGVYLAYDFRFPNWRKLMPHALKDELDETASSATRPEAPIEAPSGSTVADEPQSSREAPCFFSVDPEQLAESPVVQHSPTKLLPSLPATLQWGRLQVESHAMWMTRFQTNLRELESALKQWVKQQRDSAEELSKKLLTFCVREIFEVPGGRDGQGRRSKLRTPVNARLVKEFNEALFETAPWYAKPFLQVRRTTRDVGDWFASLPVSKVTNAISKAWSRVTKRGSTNPRIEDSISAIGAKGLSEKLQERRWVSADADLAELTRAWESVLQRVDELSKHFSYDREALRVEAKETWSSISGTRKATLAFASVGLPILVVAAAIDGGASLAASFIAVTGIAVPAGVAAIQALPGVYLLLMTIVPGVVGVLSVPILRDASRYLSTIFYLASDVFGLPRCFPGQTQRQVSVGGTELEILEPEKVGLAEVNPTVVVRLDPDAGLYEINPELAAFLETGETDDAR